MNEWLREQLKTTKNLCEIAQILMTDNEHLLPTILELLLIEVQQIVDDNCIDEECE